MEFTQNNLRRTLLQPKWLGGFLLLVLCQAATPCIAAQCAGTVAGVGEAAVCTERRIAASALVEVDPARAYALDELIDIAESNNPRTRAAWEQAKQAAARVGMARSAYYPQLAGTALFGNSKFINPFPRPLAPHGFTMVEMPVADAGLSLEYTIFDFGHRRAQLDADKAGQLAVAANFERTNQDVAYSVVLAYYRLITAQEKLEAIRQILETARTTQAQAEAQLANGRSTLPDVLNAKAGTARAEYDLESSLGDDAAARVALREAIGVEPSEAIMVAKPTGMPAAGEVSASAAALVETALQARPDLASLAEKLHVAEEELKASRTLYRPTVEFAAKESVQSIWPTVSKQYGSSLADTTQFVWSTELKIHWDFFDGGLRRSAVLARASEERESAEALREKRESVTREAWTAYLQFRTATRQQQAAETLLQAATTSYEASLDAYGYGVKNLIDLVNAESQLAEARLAAVQARSAVLSSAANLGYTTGELLRKKHAEAPADAARP
jgi:outer membrane protein TolC